MRKIALLLCLSTILLCRAQGPHKLGIKTSINISSLLGTELQNPRPKFGYSAGAYFIYNKESKWSIYSEVLGNFKGSNFDNGDIGYSKIALFYVDLSVLPSYKMKESENTISGGPYLSYLGLSSMYVGSKKLAELNNIGLKDYDAGLALFYKINGINVSFQVGAKVSLMNANNGLSFDGYVPETGKDGLIRNISLELGMLF